jgi:hypothetical protein
LHIVIYHAFTGFDTAVAVAAGRDVQFAEDNCFRFGPLTRSASYHLLKQMVGITVTTRTPGNTQNLQSSNRFFI